MPRITFLPSNKTCEMEPGTSLQKAAEQAGVMISFPCAGKGVCGKCLVKIEEGAVSFENNGKLPQNLADQGYVLACKSTVADSDAVILAASSVGDEQGQFSDAISRIGIESELFPTKDDISPFTKSTILVVSPPEMLDGLGDYDRFVQAVKDKFADCNPVLPLNLLQRLPDALREKDGEITVWYAQTKNGLYIIDIAPGDETKLDYGLAIDIGTTTVALQLVDMVSARSVDTLTLYNSQIDRGADVISRISYAKNPERILEMKNLILSTINEGIETLCKNNNVENQLIRNITISANTTMVELFLGINPNFIRLDPYTPAVMAVPEFSAGEIGININPCALVVMAPNIGSYVGGDITAGLLCTDFALDSEEVNLFIDIGTNGEIILGNNDFLLGCACSAGPAFEGGGIEMGMRASVGAIERVEIDPETGIASYSVIGKEKAKGICGSGLITLVAELFEHKIIDMRGKLDRSGRYKNIDSTMKNAKYYLESPANGDAGIYVTENDIDNFIRAKAAIFSACVTLLKSVDLDFDCIDKFYIAGGFGRYIPVANSQTVGLLPCLDEDKFKFIGNSSLTGSFMSLISDRHRRKITELANRITYVDLSTELAYMDEYIAAMFIPHTDLSLFSIRQRRI